MDLQEAFDAARRCHPEPLMVRSGGMRQRFMLVDADAECGRCNPHMGGRLVLQESRSYRAYDHDDPELDDWRVESGGPRNHWGFTTPSS